MPIQSAQVLGNDILIVFITGAAFRYFNAAHYFDAVVASRSAQPVRHLKFEQVH